jgi:hypothetical protein
VPGLGDFGDRLVEVESIFVASWLIPIDVGFQVLLDIEQRIYVVRDVTAEYPGI